MVGEILFGVLHARPRPAPRHGRATHELEVELGPPLGRGRGRGGPGGWLFIVAPELHLGPHVVVPDLAGWKRERLSPFPDTAFIETPPDWLCEVLQAVDRTDKLTIYAQFGVGHCWYVDPIARTLEVLALSGGTWVIMATSRDADAVAAPPFEMHRFSLDVLWAPSGG